MNSPSHTNGTVPAEIAGQGAYEDALLQALDMSAWTSGQNLAEIYAKYTSDQVRTAVREEEDTMVTLRNEIMPQIARSIPFLDEDVAFYQFNVDQLQKAHLGLLFNGATEACDGTIVSHDTVPLTITQIGVCLVSYSGEQGAYAHRIFRKELHVRGDDPINDVMQLLEERRKREIHDGESDSVQFKSALAQRGLMAYAERAILLEKSKALWRMGHGQSFPYELLTGFWGSREEMTRAAMDLFTRMAEYKRVVFIPSAPNMRAYLTIGNALKPLEYIVVGTLRKPMMDIIRNGGTRGEKLAVQKAFVENFADDWVIGLYKASEYGPAHVFYAHRDHVKTAALIAISDSVLQEHRGFPMLIDIADNICSATFSPDSFYSTIRNAYAEAGQPFRYLGERETRTK